MQIKSFIRIAGSALAIAAAISMGDVANGASHGGGGHSGGGHSSGGRPGGSYGSRPGGSGYRGSYGGGYRGGYPRYSGGLYIGLGGYYGPWYYGNYGYGWNYPYNYYGYGYGDYGYNDPTAAQWYWAQQQAQAATNSAVAAVNSQPTPEIVQSAYPPSSSSYLTDARAAFLQGDYNNASRLAAHAAVEDPQNAQVHELASLALFASSNYRAASGAAHSALGMASPADWSRLYNYYRNADLYTSQLRALEKYTVAHPDSAPERFLLGYHYLMIGENAKAKREFAATMKLTPQDEVAKHYAQATPSAGPTLAVPPALEKPVPPVPSPVIENPSGESM